MNKYLDDAIVAAKAAEAHHHDQMNFIAGMLQGYENIRNHVVEDDYADDYDGDYEVANDDGAINVRFNDGAAAGYDIRGMLSIDIALSPYGIYDKDIAIDDAKRLGCFLRQNISSGMYEALRYEMNRDMC